MKSPYDIILKPIITERSTENMQDRKYTFEVDKRANKVEIKQAIEEIFKVDVERVNTMIVLGKYKRMGVHTGKRKDIKKAIVKLAPGSKDIEFFEGMV